MARVANRPLLTKFRVWGAYALLLVLSALVRFHVIPDEGELPAGSSRVEVEEIGKKGNTGDRIQLAFRDVKGNSPDVPVLLLVHGAADSSGIFDPLLEELGGKYRILVPDLPGFGASTHDVASYSGKTHAAYLLDLLDHLGISGVHVVAFSSGGIPALNLLEMESERFKSLTLVSALGVQELDLLGEYSLNHAVHTVQLGAIWALQNLTPHFGLLDRTIFNLSFARTTYESDQRPLREILEELMQPVLILHGEGDLVVPAIAAKEHERILPQSETEWFEGRHRILTRRVSEVAEDIYLFVSKVERGKATTREDADVARIEASENEFKFSLYQSDLKKWTLAFIVLIALATLVSEDITCVTAGILAALGIFPFSTAVIGCFLGILLGDIGVYMIGRCFGAPAIGKPPLKWMITPRQVTASARFFDRYGPLIIVGTRWLPGLRVPVYVTAGLLKRGLIWFTGWMVVGAALWTPVLVGLSMLLGEQLLVWVRRFENYALLILLAVMGSVILLTKIVLATATWRGRRQTVGWWRRLTRWEFWPPWIIYPPVVLYVIWQGVKRRCLTLFTAVNPAMPAGGLIGESKSEILGALGGDGSDVARFALIPSQATVEEGMDRVSDFMGEKGLDWPVVIKPDSGERGKGVGVLRSIDEVREKLESGGETEWIVQEFVPGEEYGVFYVRDPREEKGRIISVTEKRLIYVTGDGSSSLERLIYADERAVCMAPFFIEKHEDRLDEILMKGERFRLTDLGTHCRGAMFLDACDTITPELTESIDRMSRRYEGFYFGRYDLRVPSRESLMRGEGIKALELNGVTSEATHIYDPKHGIFNAWSVLCGQWGMAFEIGAENRRRGAKPVAWWPLMRLIFGRSKSLPGASGDSGPSR